jgi:hypothetical protein
VLTEAQVAALEKTKLDKEAHDEFKEWGASTPRWRSPSPMIAKSPWALGRSVT